MYLSVSTSLKEQSQVVVVGRSDVDELQRSMKMTVETRSNHGTQVLVMKSNHDAAVLHHLVEILLRRTCVLCTV